MEMLLLMLLLMMLLMMLLCVEVRKVHVAYATLPCCSCCFCCYLLTSLADCAAVVVDGGAVPSYVWAGRPGGDRTGKRQGLNARKEGKEEACKGGKKNRANK